MLVVIVGVVLGDESVCEIMETTFSICFQMRLSGTSPFDQFETP